jgi:hypothetical protein
MIPWSTIVTGAVGAAGIGGAIFVARMGNKSQAANLLVSIGAEDERLRLAEKRRVYALFLGACSEVRSQAFVSRHHANQAEVLADRAMAISRALAAAAEVRLIASDALGDLADRLSRLANEIVDDDKDEYFQVRSELLGAMRADLDETDQENT